MTSIRCWECDETFSSPDPSEVLCPECWREIASNVERPPCPGMTRASRSPSAETSQA